MNNSDRKIIWLFLDGKAGHENQSKSLINELKKYIHVNVCEFSLCAKTKKELFNQARNAQSPDYILGAGHGTHLFLILFRLIFGGRTVVLMRPTLPLIFFDYCLIPEHDGAPSRKNVFHTVGAINSLSSECDDEAITLLILLGGESKEFDWDFGLVWEQLKDSLLRPVGKVVILGSRRTPAEDMSKIKDRVRSLHSSITPLVFTSEEKNYHWLNKALPCANEVWVTVDSVNMISEALSTNAKVKLLKLPAKRLGRVFSGTELMIKRGWLSYVNDTSSGLASFADLPLNEGARAARWILSKNE
jgi:mitochondrial fission protein ELM1